jgi:lysophospholipase L1-like esterase
VSRIGADTLRGDTTPRVTGAAVNWIGDSIAPPAQSSSGFGRRAGGVAFLPYDFLAWAHLLSNGRLLYGKPAGVNGQTTVDMMPRIDTDALTWGGSFCGITAGTNDALLLSLSPASFAANIRTMCAAIVSRGQIPILTTLLPQPTQPTLVDQYRRFQTAYAADNGWPLVDWHSLLVDPTSSTDVYLSSLAADGYHPNNAGKRVMGQALVDALTPYLPPWTNPLQTSNTTANANLLDNSQFRTDTNSDGVPDGWSKSGPGTVSLVSDAAVNGKAMRLVDSAGGSTVVSVTGGISGSFGGHRLAFTGKIKNPGTGAVALALSLNTGVILSPAFSWTEPFTGWQSFYLEIVAPASTTLLGLSMTSGVGATGVDASVAQLGIFDITACGI